MFVPHTEIYFVMQSPCRIDDGTPIEFLIEKKFTFFYLDDGRIGTFFSVFVLSGARFLCFSLKYVS
jgi:hypothetical protein